MGRFPWAVTVTALTLTACTNMCGVKRSSMTPEQVVEAYLDVALSMHDVSERDKLLEYTTGALKSAVEGASVETIKSAYIDRKYHLLNYSVVERKDRTPRETEITFELSYNDLGTAATNLKDAPVVKTENTVSVVKVTGEWFIRDVLGNKTSIDFPLAEPITAKAGPGTDTPADQGPDPNEGQAPQNAPDDPGAVQGG